MQRNNYLDFAAALFGRDYRLTLTHMLLAKSDSIATPKAGIGQPIKPDTSRGLSDSAPMRASLFGYFFGMITVLSAAVVRTGIVTLASYR